MRLESSGHDQFRKSDILRHFLILILILITKSVLGVLVSIVASISQRFCNLLLTRQQVSDFSSI